MSLKRLWYYFKIAVSGSEKNFTSGSINRAIFMLSIPMILEMVMESLFAVVDVFFVAQIGVNAVATVGLTESVLMLLYSISIGLSMATTAVVARRVGEGKPTDAANAAFQSLFIATILAVIIGISGVVFSSDILRLMGGSEELVEDGVNYTRFMFGGNFTILFLFLINAIFRGAGDASLAMRTLILSNGLNLILDPCLIMGLGPFPEMGLEGAAIATNIGRGCGVLFQFYFLLSRRAVIKIGWENVKVKWEIVKKIISISLGGIGQFIIGSASWIFLVRIISMFGSEAVAGYTISFRIIVFTILPSWGVANAAATLVGQNLGAKMPDRAEKSVWLSAFYNMLFLLLVSIIFFTWANEFVLIFSKEPEVVRHGVASLKIICLGYVFFAYGMVISQSFNGAGDTSTPTIINFICYWIIQIPLAYFLAVNFNLGSSGVYIAIAASLSILAVICILVFKRGKWKTVAL